jgi:hypothetical protein
MQVRVSTANYRRTKAMGKRRTSEKLHGISFSAVLQISDGKLSPTVTGTTEGG